MDIIRHINNKESQRREEARIRERDYGETEKEKKERGREKKSDIEI